MKYAVSENKSMDNNINLTPRFCVACNPWF